MAIGKVVEAYKANKNPKNPHSFGLLSAIVYDQRNMSVSMDYVSLVTLEGRIKIPLVVSGYHQGIIKKGRVKGQADLVLVDDVFDLLLVVDLPEPPQNKPVDFLGVGLGIKNIATDSDGNNFSGSYWNHLRKRHFKLRQRLQKKGTKSAKRLLKKRRQKEARFARVGNHRIAKELVQRAQDTGRGIALEDLKGICERVTVKKPQRRQPHSWAFHQLRHFIEYKAKLAGVPVVYVVLQEMTLSVFSVGTLPRLTTTLRKTSAGLPSTSRTRRANAQLQAPSFRYGVVDIDTNHQS